MSISKLNGKIRVMELSVLIEKITVVLERNTTIENPFLPTLTKMARAFTSELQSSINSSKVYSNIEESDNLRDKSIRALFNMVTGLTYFPDPEIKEAAKTVLDVLNNYSLDMLKGNYDRETALVKKLVADFGKTVVATAMAKLPGVSDLLAELSANQTKFDEAQQAWNVARVKDEKSPTEIKREVVPFINSVLLSFLDVAFYLQNDIYKDMALEIEGFIESENRLLG